MRVTLIDDVLKPSEAEICNLICVSSRSERCSKSKRDEGLTSMALPVRKRERRGGMNCTETRKERRYDLDGNEKGGEL